MSSNIRIVKVCEYCKKEFVARTTVTKCCSDPCAKRLYKLKQRNNKIAQAELKTEIKRMPDTFFNDDQIKAIQAKVLLNFKESALILNVSLFTLRRWILQGKIASHKVGNNL